jgi:hypothetical protein
MAGALTSAADVENASKDGRLQAFLLVKARL